MRKNIAKIIFLLFCAFLFIAGVLISVLLINSVTGYYAFASMAICVVGLIIAITFICYIVRGG